MIIAERGNRVSLCCTLLAGWLVCSAISHAETIHVPSDYPSLAQAIAAAENGDEILVADGTYSGAENRSIRIDKTLTIRSENGPGSCVLNAQQSDRFFQIFSPAAVHIEGFTFMNGYVDHSYAVCGGAIDSSGELTVNRCVFRNNRLRCRGDDHDSAYGSAIQCYSTLHSVISNSVFYLNYCDSDVYWGGAIHGADHVFNCTFYRNGGEENSYFDASTCFICGEITNCIFFDNPSPVTDGHETQTTCYQGNPFFLSLDPFDYHLDVSSPCIDTGTDILLPGDIDGDTRPLFGGYDIGADEFAGPDYTPPPTITPEPTATPPPTPVPSNSPLPSATSTPLPTPPMVYELVMPDADLTAGDLFDLSVHRFNYGNTLIADEYVILEVSGELFFWPVWEESVSGEFGKTIVTGDSTQSILYFEWPEVTGSMTGLHFFAVLLQPQIFDLLGFDAIEFGYH